MDLIWEVRDCSVNEVGNFAGYKETILKEFIENSLKLVQNVANKWNNKFEKIKN